MDAVESNDDLFDGFYEITEAWEDKINEINEAKLKHQFSISEKFSAEREKRLLESVSALCETMEIASKLNFDKILNASIEDEQKRRGEALKKRIEEAERLMAGKKRQVEVSVSFLNLGDVDAFKETFAAEVIISLRWRELALDSWTTADLKTVDFESFYNPCMYVENMLIERRGIITNKVERNDRGETFMTEKITARGLFSFKGNLQSFPFDVQDLSIVLTTDLSTEDVELVPSKDELSSIKMRLQVDQLRQSWHLHDHIDIQLRTLNAEISGAMNNRPAFEVIARVARDTKFYWYNNYAIVFFITLMASLTFVIDPVGNGTNSLAARMHLCLMVFLNVISYKISVSMTMPKLSYLTCVDIYIICNLLSLIIVTFYYAVELSNFGNINASDMRSADRFAMIGSIGGFIFWNAIYFSWLRLFVCVKKSAALKQDIEWAQFVKKKMGWISVAKPPRALSSTTS